MQPLQGASRNGALRVGEMEQDAFLAWGMVIGLHERFLSQSDGTVITFCRECGLPATELPPRPGERISQKKCMSCAAKAIGAGQVYVPQIASVYMSRASFVVMLTWLSMGVCVRPTF